MSIYISTTAQDQFEEFVKMAKLHIGELISFISRIKNTSITTKGILNRIERQKDSDTMKYFRIVLYIQMSNEEVRQMIVWYYEIDNKHLKIYKHDDVGKSLFKIEHDIA